MLNIILPVAIGGLIGYCTNYIAIKMLFRPRRAIYIGKWQLPFTPGVIPKNQKRIANAVATAVSEQLITKDDLLGTIANDEVKTALSHTITKLLLDSEHTGSQLASMANRTSDAVSGELITALEQADLMPVIRDIGGQALQNYLQNPMIAMFLNESMLESVYTKINDSIKEYVHINGKNLINGFIQKKTEDLTDASLRDVLDRLDITEDDLNEFISSLVDKFVASAGDTLIEKIDIRHIVAEKIEAMPAEDLERLVMSVMKHELSSIVNLGALIGALIGILNIFI